MRALVLAVVMMGCGPARLPGAPEPGEACAMDAPVCMTTESVGTCVAQKWTEWPCVDACSNTATPRCEKVLPTKAGEACPPGSIDGGGLACVPVDGGVSNLALKCVSGVAREVECARCANGTAGGVYCS